MVTTLDAEAVLGAGIGLARTHGLESVGVRAVAARLGVTPMALYRHIGDAATLRAGVLDGLLAEIPHVSDGGTWQERYRDWARSTRRVVRRCPGLARVILTRWVELPRMLDIVEELLAVADEADVELDQVATANAVFIYVLMRVEAEHAVRTTGGLRRNLRRVSANGQRLPLLSRHAGEYSVARLDEHFAFGLDALLAGLPLARRNRGA